jgi:hypothetical protein
VNEIVMLEFEEKYVTWRERNDDQPDLARGSGGLSIRDVE